MNPRRIEFGVYLPQLRLDFRTLRERVQCAEALGYDTAWFYDHLHPPGTPDVPGFEGWTLVSALAPLTERIPLVARHADVWNCPTYSLALIERKRDAMLRECEKQGRDPATLVFGQQAVVVLVERESELEAAMRIARRRFGAEQWGLDAGGFVGT